MTHEQLPPHHPLLCQGPTTDPALAAMANLESMQAIKLGRAPSVQATAEQWQTAEGTRVSFIAAQGRPMIDLVLRFRAGSMLDGDTPGLAALALYSLDQGTEDLDAAQFAQRLAGLGATLSRKISEDSTSIALRCLSMPTLRAQAIGLLTQMVARPALREAEVAKIRERIAFNQARQSRHPILRMANATMSHVFHGHPYAAPPAARPADDLGAEQVRAFHQKAYSANNLDIGLVGDVSRAEAEQLVNMLVQALPQQWAAQTPPAPADPLPLVQHVDFAGNATQAMLTIAARVAPKDPPYPALVLLTAILGGSYEARLTQELRHLRGLTYAVSAFLRPLDATTLFQIHWDVVPQHRDASGALVSAMLNCLREHGPSQAECDMAVNQIAARLHHDLADHGKLASALATYSHQGLPADHLTTYVDTLAALTPANLLEAAQVWLGQAPEVFVTSGPAVEQLPLSQPTADER